MGRFLFSMVAGTVLIAAVAGAQQAQPQTAPASAAFDQQQGAVPFELFRGSRIMLDGTINGTRTDMLLDSGASMTTLDREFARKIGIKADEKISVEGATGSVPGEIASGISIEVGGLKLTNVTVMIIDLSIASRGIGRPIPAVLGQDAFKASVVKIDFPKRTIAFSAPGKSAIPAKAARLPLDEDGGLPVVDISINGAPPIEAHFDLGNGGTVLLSKNYWAAQPKIASLKLAESLTGGVGGMRPARKTTLPTVEFAGVRFDNVPAVLNEDPAALPREGGNLGLEMLKAFVVTIDTPGGAMYLEQTAQHAALKRERAGVGAHYHGDRLKVMFVSSDGPAAKSGLKPGDEIVAVDGRAVGSDYYEQPEWIYGEAGRKVVLTRADHSTVEITLADYF